ncbi:hypothetical protein [Lacticaseibacillus hulanensis]|jgi:antitoxin (DNA-binding transcriptional repressor) of toxin-antitoxin stability system|uniref:hypothetical protein n=1 Tax=Lacticaseibacillus hulanensis TaxID=2493111 RepID=UPI000FD9AE37|nr:hypothetical protein [Lacticaseibacillus hulanensis]
MTELDPAVSQLLDKVNEGFDVPMDITVTGEPSAELRNADGDTQIDEQLHGHITVTNPLAVDYTVSHELWHVLLRLMNFPSTGTAVHTENKDYNDQMRAIAGGLEAGVIHRIIVGWQAEANLLTPTVLKAVRAGIEADTPVEVGEEDDGMVLTRIFNLLDGLLVLGGPDSDMISAWYTKYPMALKFATELYNVLTEADLSEPRTYRVAIVKMFKQFNETMSVMGLNLDFENFIVVPPVLSKRQLRLSLSQLYLLSNSEYVSDKPHTTAYTALGKSDNQAAFVLQLDKNQTKPEYFQKLYDRPLGDVLDEFGIGYTVRQ